MTRVPISLTDDCLFAIRALAKQEYRDVRQQVAWIVEQELKRRGLLQAKSIRIAEHPTDNPKHEPGGKNATH